MKILGFIIFLIAALVYIWNGKDYFNKKEWRAFFIKFIFVLIGAFLLVLFLVGLLKVFPSISKDSLRELTVVLPASFSTVLLLKFLVVMINTLFSFIMRFHQRYNSPENYMKLSSLTNRFGPRLLLLVKCLTSFAGIIMFYGIWFGTTP